MPQVPQDLLLHNCLLYKSLDHMRPWYFLENDGKTIEIKVRGSFSANSSQTLLNVALNHVGIAKLSSHIVQA